MFAGESPPVATWYKQRLKQVKVAPVDERDVHRGALERHRGVEPGKAAADDDDAVRLTEAVGEAMVACSRERRGWQPGQPSAHDGRAALTPAMACPWFPGRRAA